MTIEEKTPWSLRSRWALAVCAAYATLLAVLPHAWMYVTRGTPEFLSFHDDLTYLHISIPPYSGGLGLRDPYSADWEGGLCLHAWAQFVPTAKLAAALGIPVRLLPLVWRVIGAPFLGAGLYLIFGRVLAGTRWPVGLPLACALIALSDFGFMWGRPVIDQLLLLRHIRDGTTPWPAAIGMLQYRVITPILNFPIVLLLCAVLMSGPLTTRSSILGALCLGLCCLLYFFAWTAAAFALGIYLAGLLLRSAFSPAGRSECRRRAVVVAVALFGGLALGSPQIVMNARTAADPSMKAFLDRAGRPVVVPAHLPPPTTHQSRSSYVELAVGAAALLFLRLPGLGLVYSFLLSGFLLWKSAWATRLEFENFHWLMFVVRPFGEIVLLASAAGLADRFAGRRSVRVATAVVAAGATAVVVVIALIFIPMESVRAREAILYNRITDELRPLRPQLAALPADRRITGPADPLGVALLDTRAVSLWWHPTTWLMATAPLGELHMRHALHGWLLGLDEDAYRRLAEKELYPMAIAAADRRRQTDDAVEARFGAFRRLQAGGAADELERFRVGYLILPTGAIPTRGGPWAILGRSSAWTLWERGPTGPGKGR